MKKEEAAKDYVAENFKNGTKGLHVRTVAEYAFVAGSEWQSKQKNKWIPITEKLPEIEKSAVTFSIDVLFCADGKIYYGWYHYTFKIWYADNSDNIISVPGVTAWQYAPNAYK